MRERTVKRFYCDHCKRAGLSRFHMAKHENGCTKNPARACRMHVFVAKGEVVPAVTDLVAAITRGGLKELRLVAHSCPACILAGIVQFPWPPYPTPDLDRDGNVLSNTDRHPYWDECAAFDFKKERDEFWAEERVSQQEMHDAYYYG